MYIRIFSLHKMGLGTVMFCPFASMGILTSLLVTMCNNTRVKVNVDTRSSWLNCALLGNEAVYWVSRGCPVLKIEFGPPHADFGSIWSPQKAREFRLMQQTTEMGILWQFQFDTVSFPVRSKFCRPLHCLVILTLWFLQLSKLLSFLVHQLFGTPKLALERRTCAPCAAILRTGGVSRIHEKNKKWNKKFNSGLCDWGPKPSIGGRGLSGPKICIT